MTTTDATVTAPSGEEHPGEWIPLPGFSKYEIRSRGGYGLAEDQWPVRHKTKRTFLKVTLGTNGYPRVQPYNDQGKQETRTVHSLILLANVGPPSDGMQTRHLDSDPLNYRWAAGSTDEEIKAAGGNLVYGSGPENHADQVAAGTAVRPLTSQCANYTTCGNMTASTAITRCPACSIEAGSRAAAMLAKGTPLAAVTRKLGYTSEVHVHALARQYGGYTGTLAQARAGRPLLRRVLGRFRRGPR